MNGITLVFLTVAYGFGLGSGWWLWRSRQPIPPTTLTPIDHAETQPLLQQLQQTELAYQMAHELSQFKGGFLARTSHELRSPLNGLIGMHQLILSDLCDSPEEEREFLAQANESALKMVRVLDSLIEVSKLEHGTSQLDMQPIQLMQVLEDVYSLTRLQAENRNLRLKILSPNPDLYVLSDPRRLLQVLVSLVDAAIAQMEAGFITVLAEATDASNYAHIWIEDERPQTAWQEAIDLLQTPPSTNQVVPSPGLNLLVAQTLLTLMQGRLEVLSTTSESTPNRMQCSLPLVEYEIEAIAEGNVVSG